MHMKRFIAALAISLATLNSLSLPALAWKKTLPGFNGYRFSETGTNQEGGVQMVPDPIDPGNADDVYRFSIKPGPCVGSDCDHQSARATVQQRPDAKQPHEVWYGWDIYFPPDFPINGKQSSGKWLFNEWKDQSCNLASLSLDANLGGSELIWEMSKLSGKAADGKGNDCMAVMRAPLGKMSKLLGSWHRFEVYARWTKSDDGRFIIYMDGEVKLDYSGVTCSNCDRMNFYLFGNYLCCTESTTSIQPSTVYYRYLSRAKRREDLQWH